MVLKMYGDLAVANACILKSLSPAPEWFDGIGGVEKVRMVTADGCDVQWLVLPV